MWIVRKWVMLVMIVIIVKMVMVVMVQPKTSGPSSPLTVCQSATALPVALGTLC